jgi:hypothetical protein
MDLRIIAGKMPAGRNADWKSAVHNAGKMPAGRKADWKSAVHNAGKMPAGRNADWKSAVHNANGPPRRTSTVVTVRHVDRPIRGCNWPAHGIPFVAANSV